MIPTQVDKCTCPFLIDNGRDDPHMADCPRSRNYRRDEPLPFTDPPEYRDGEQPLTAADLAGPA